jgi:nucleotide-binding universal stress UspA family protein
MLKAILASLTGFASDRTVMETAFALARINAGHVEALHTRVDAAEVAAITQVAASHAYGTLHEVARNIGQEESSRSRAAQNAYAGACARHLSTGMNGSTEKITAFYREVTTLTNETLHQARVHDITVTARVPELAPDRLDSLVMSAGKPILVAPARPPATVGETVAIAWKNTPEAARAVTAALPVLAHAGHVIVMAIAESRTQAEAERESADGLVALLKRHGISAQLRFSAAAATSAAEKLKEIAYEADADLIVMGAYGHSRMRELILGGATRALLADCDIAVLLVH